MTEKNLMVRRQFLKASAMLGGGFITAGSSISSANAQESNLGGVTKPFRIVMGGYGPSTSSFSRV